MGPMSYNWRVARDSHTDSRGYGDCVVSPWARGDSMRISQRTAQLCYSTAWLHNCEAILLNPNVLNELSYVKSIQSENSFCTPNFLELRRLRGNVSKQLAQGCYPIE